MFTQLCWGLALCKHCCFDGTELCGIGCVRQAWVHCPRSVFSLIPFTVGGPQLPHGSLAHMSLPSKRHMHRPLHGGQNICRQTHRPRCKCSNRPHRIYAVSDAAPKLSPYTRTYEIQAATSLRSVPAWRWYIGPVVVGNVGDLECQQLSPMCIWNATAGRHQTRLLSVWSCCGQPSTSDGLTCNTPYSNTRIRCSVFFQCSLSTRPK